MSPDGKTIAATANGIHFVDVATGKRTSLGEHEGRSIGFSPDGKRLAAVPYKSAPDHGVEVRDAEWKKIVSKIRRVPSGEPFLAWSPDSKTLACDDWFFDPLTGAPRGRLITLNGDKGLAVSAAGHYRLTRFVERDLLYVTKTAKGQETLTPAAMAKKYGWQNDPERVRLTP